MAFRSLASMKLKDVPTFVKSVATKENVSKNTWNFLYNYNQKYIQGGSIRPVNDVMICVGILSYFVGWPTELRHLKHAEEAAAHAGEKGGHH
ncbi:hypothetical protein R1flu_013326 [Riccia fluitans]|uniref:Uncharacterized protein n=1 Tax=Riccia fluitans TaxID=41844 RepID=A0ABD1YD87_9MARC